MDDVMIALTEALRVLRHKKPDDHSAIDRAWAITITMLEQTIAYYNTWVLYSRPK